MSGDLYFVEPGSDIAQAGFELSIQPKILCFHLPGVGSRDVHRHPPILTYTVLRNKSRVYVY